MIAKFIGKTSMGFIHGRTYTIKSDIKPIWIGGKQFGRHMPCICIYDINSREWCPYDSLEAFLRNWEIIHT